MERKEKKVGTGSGEGGRGWWQEDKKAQPRPRWKLGSQAPSTCCTVSRTGQMIPKQLEIGCTVFRQSFVLGSLNLRQLFSGFVSQGGGCERPSGTAVSGAAARRRRAAAGSSLCSLTLTLSQLSTRCASPPPARAESSDVVFYG